MVGEVLGIGGVFFKAKDPARLREWYRTRLGVESDADGAAVFRWRDDQDTEARGSTTWSIFDEESGYLGPASARFMINYRVADLGATLERLRTADVWVDERVEQTEYGRFGWIADPEGNRIELWQPPPGW
jgi:predicted enzyme related to lactoylglutathione lyase